VGALVILIAVVVGIWFSPLRAQLTRENLHNAVDQARGAWYTPIVFILVYAAGCVVALPASVFVITAGFIWGWGLGGVYALTGSLLGATASYFVARFIGSGLLDRFGSAGRAVAKRVDNASFWSLVALRNIPGVPFVVLNYGSGVAGVRFRDYFFSTLVGIIPSMFVFTYCADALFNGSMSEGDAFKRLVIVCSLMLAMILLPRLIVRLVSKRKAEVA
jgi:uncharacterized membrane protein YdjX (TVP38/TMEM64 family)